MICRVVTHLQQEAVSVSHACRLLQVSRSGYYAHRSAGPSAKRLQEHTHVKAAFAASGASYGTNLARECHLMGNENHRHAGVSELAHDLKHFTDQFRIERAGHVDSGNPDAAESMMVEHFTGRVEGIRTDLSNAFPARKGIFDAAFDAHLSGVPLPLICTGFPHSGRWNLH
ncbi:hypothetical protein QFZ99_004690 [Paraburkholderia atlantica]